MTDKEKTPQKLYIQLQILEQNIKQLQQQITYLNAQIIDMLSTKQGIEDLKSVEAGTDILVQINSGVYAKAKLSDNKTLIVNVGSNTSVEKDISETKKLIEKQIDEMKKLHEQSIQELQQLTSHSARIENELKSLTED